MLGKPRIRLNNLKTGLRFPCLGLNPVIDSISLIAESHMADLNIWAHSKDEKHHFIVE